MKGSELAESAHDRVEIELAGAVRQTLSEQAVRVGDVGDLGCRPELFDVPLQREILVRGQPEEGRIRGRERAKQGGMRGVEGEAELGHALAPFQEVTPMAADLREEDAARPHAQDRRDVLDQRHDIQRRAGVGVVAQELLDRPRIHRAGGAELTGREWNEEVDGQDRRPDLCGEAGAAVDAGARLVVQPVDAHERAARPRDGRLGGNGDAEARRDADRLLYGLVARRHGSRRGTARARASRRRRGGRRSARAQARL